MSKYYPPEFEKEQFNCVYCGVYAAQEWGVFVYDAHGPYRPKLDLKYCVCLHCSKWSYWHFERMIVPTEAPVPPAHQDMPADCIDDYNEARDIVARSPKAASALLRLTVQKLLIFLGESGKKINDDIGNLVKNGLPVQVQQALDYCRVVGNNAVHPGEIDLNDSPEIAHQLFQMINFIVEERISRPKHIDQLFNTLPEGALNSIAQRDSIKS